MKGQTPLHVLCRGKLDAGFYGFQARPKDAVRVRAAKKARRALIAKGVPLLLNAWPEAANAKDKAGNTPLHRLFATTTLWATSTGLLHQLLTRCTPATVAAPNKRGRTPLHILCQWAHTPLHTVRLFVQEQRKVVSLTDSFSRGARAMDDFKACPLHYLCCNRAVSAEALSVLVAAYPDAAKMASGHCRHRLIGALCWPPVVSGNRPLS